MLRDSRASPVPFTLPGGQACVLQSPESGGDGRVLVLVHNPPIDDKDHPLVQHLARSLGFTTVAIDLTGCGESSGATKLVSHERDADDLSACVRHCGEVLGLEVAGLVGLGGGGTAALVLAARRTHAAFELVVTVGAHASVQAGGAERAAGLTWSQLERLKADGAVDGFKDSRGRARRLECAAAELSGDVTIELSGLARCDRTHFLALHGSQDTRVSPAEAERLRPLLAGGASSEVRVVAGAASFASDPERLSYAIRDWVWRHAQSQDAPGSGSAAGAPAVGGGRSPAAGSPTHPLEPQPSGFNIFVENLSESVNEIHRDVQSNLPSMDAGGDSDNDDSDGEAEVPILTPRGARIAAAAREGAS